jgi:hypothetical protein
MPHGRRPLAVRARPMLAKTCPILSNAPVSLATPGAGPDDGFMADSMDSMDSMDELRALLRRHGQDANTLTPIPRPFRASRFVSV